MNNKPKSSAKTIAIIIVIAIIVAIVYFYYTGKSNDSGTDTVSLAQSNAEDQAIGARVLALLNQINSLKIDTSIFKDPGYLTLRDYSVTIPPVDVGRSNPFAPIPGFSTTPSR